MQAVDGAPATRTAVSLRRRVFQGAGLTVWTRQLAGLVGAGLPLERALTALADDAEDPRQRDLVAQLRSEVNAGHSFAHALATAPREFDDVYRAVVGAGEQGGALVRAEPLRAHAGRIAAVPDLTHLVRLQPRGDGRDHVARRVADRQERDARNLTPCGEIWVRLHNMRKQLMLAN